MKHFGSFGGFGATRGATALPRPPRALRTRAEAGPTPPLSAPSGRMPPGPHPAPPQPQVLGGLMLSGFLHASAALALVATQIALSAGAAGNGGQDSLTLPSPPSVQVTLLTPADLVPNQAPPPPPTQAPTLAPAPLAPAPLASDTPPDLAVQDVVAPPDLAALTPPQADAPPPVAEAPPPVPVKPLAVVLDEKGDVPPPSAPSKARPEKTAKAKTKKAAPPPAETVAAKAAGSGGGALAGASGAAAEAGVSKAREADLKAAWGSKVRSRVEARKSYPRSAAGASGTVKVRLTVARDGSLLGVSVAATSGVAALDQAALKAVRSAGRFPAAPKGLSRDSYSFTLPMRFAP